MNYFITGGTGFIGRVLVARLLRRGGRIYLLVRPGSRSRVEGLRRLWGAPARRIVAVEGDLGEARLGVKPAWIRQHAGKIDHFFHLAAIYDMAADAASQRRANIAGTEQALALARELGAGCFHHFSSIAVAGLYRGTFTEDMFEQARGLDHPYFSSKHAAEARVRQEKGLPWRIYRPGMVVGDSRSGEMLKVDGPYYFFEVLRLLAAFAPRRVPLPVARAGLLNIVPVDFVADAVDYLAHLPGHDNECFLITDPRGVRTGEALRALSQAAGGPALVPLDNPLLSASGQLAAAAGRLPPLEQLGDTLLRELGIPPQVMAYINYPTRFDSRKTQRLLEAGDIHCPPFESYAPLLWDYWQQHLRDSGALGPLGDRLRGRPTPAALRRHLRGKVVVVTGAASGIGRACALRLARSGARLVLVDRSEEGLAALEDEILRHNGRAHTYCCDLADATDRAALVQAVLRDHRRVDILLNNAGRSIRRSVRLSYERLHDFQRTMELNYFGALHLTLGFLPAMAEHGDGQVINISTIGTQVYPPRFSAYVASKAALDAFSRCAAPEFADRNVRFTTVHMPLVRTPMIAPTNLYRAFPALSPRRAADLVLGAMLDRPRQVATPLGTAGAVLEALLPGASETVLRQAYELFPDSAAARGAGASEAAHERRRVPETTAGLLLSLVGQILRGTGGRH